MPGPRPTLRDVADRAGVSASTASVVFSGRAPVAAATADRVRAAAAELGYAGPDPRASSLRRGRAGAVGVLVEGRLLHAFRDPFAVAVLDGLAQELDAIPTGMLLLAQPADDRRLLAQVADLALDALVFSMCGPAESPLVNHAAARHIPLVGTGSPLDPRVHQVRIDERAAQASAVEHLWRLGHRRIAHVTMPLARGAAAEARRLGPGELGRADFVDARLRAEGFLARAGRSAAVVEAPTADVDGGRAAARVLLASEPARRPTAIVAQSDLLAAGVLQAASARGLRVPEDLSVTGLDGLDLPWLDRPLTTVDQHGEDKGRALGRMVAALLAGEAVRDVLLPTDLREGATTAPAPPGR
ncbi:MAG TPA: LacI family DNA-binding transcriptional regulator [Marmoricola sp.]|nr:LacI family DNA-binding transcriptional regulator [Marmoricola sp.]